MGKLYRKDYLGEFYIKSRNQFSGALSEDREWIPNTIPAINHTGHAAVIGNGVSRLDINLHLITNHGGGHQGKKKLTSYGCNALYRDAKTNFLVVTGSEIITEMVEGGYTDDRVILTYPENIVAHPGKFHLIPFNKYWNAGAIATWLACFDGQKKIYLVGFDNQHITGKNINVYAGTPGYGDASILVNSDQWQGNMFDIMSTYDDVEFVLVNPVFVPESWRYLDNLRQIDVRGFVCEADLGA